MKKFLFLIPVLSLTLFANQSFAKKIDLGQIVDAVATTDSSSQKSGGKKSNNLLGGLEDQLTAKIEKVIGRIDERITKYETKIDDYEKKLDKAEAAADKVVGAINNLNAAKLQSYVAIAKYAAIAFATIFVLSFVLLIVIFVQLLRVNATLKDLKRL